MEPGQTITAIGNPFGLRGSMTSGIVSQVGRLLPVQGDFSIPNVIQTDAAINPGNSGGPLLNMQGRVVGVNTAIESRTGTFSGVGFAIPSDTVRRVVPELIRNGEYNHPWLGVSGRDLNPEISRRMNLDTTAGFLVVSVVDGGPSDGALRAGSNRESINGQGISLGGDVIVAIDGERMRGISDILTYLDSETEVGETITVTVIRDGERQDIEVSLQQRPEA
nr:MAG: trypsin-like serine protease [Candidatus Nanosalinarum sp. J07AB56]